MRTTRTKSVNKHFTFVHLLTCFWMSQQEIATRAFNGQDAGFVNLIHTCDCQSHTLQCKCNVCICILCETVKPRNYLWSKVPLALYAKKLHFVILQRQDRRQTDFLLDPSLMDQCHAHSGGGYTKIRVPSERTASNASHLEKPAWIVTIHMPNRHICLELGNVECRATDSSCSSICHGFSGFRDTRSIGPTSAQ